MKAIILAAGKGTRMGDLTKDTPKPLLVYKDKTLIEHKLDTLPNGVTDVVVVVGYLGEKIKNYFGDSWNGKKIHYAEQKEMLGTAHALFEAKELLDEPFLVLMGDDLYAKEDLARLTNIGEWALLAERSEEIQSGGKIFKDEEGNLKEIIEDKDGSLPSQLVYTGACFLSPDIFNYEMVQLPNSKEYGLPQTFSQAVGTRPINIHETTYWKRITAPEDLK